MLRSKKYGQNLYLNDIVILQWNYFIILECQNLNCFAKWTHTYVVDIYVYKCSMLGFLEIVYIKAAIDIGWYVL